jgi:two-component system, NarL family, nitrate/nitrite response regulator NarL
LRSFLLNSPGGTVLAALSVNKYFLILNNLMKPNTATRNSTETSKGQWQGSETQRDPATILPVKRIRVLIAEDHPVVRKGIIALLSNQPVIQVLGEAKDGQDALRKAKEMRPDVLLVDIEMPQLNGFVLTEILQKELPQVRVLILSAHSGSQCVPRILQSGARGYVTKSASGDELVKAIESIAGGGTHFGPEVAQLALSHLVEAHGNAAGTPRLSSREKEILTLVAEGLYNKEIAARLNIGTRTVETHRERLMRKLNIRSTAGLTTFAVANGYVVVPETPTL